MTNAYLFLYFLLAGVTWVAGEVGVGIAGRVTIADPILAGLIFSVAVGYSTRLRVPLPGRAALTMLAFFLPGVVLSPTRTTAGLLAWGIHIFLVLGFLAIYNIAAERDVDGRIELVHLWVRAAGILALIACYDLVAQVIGIPGIARSLGQAPAAQGGAVGTFRNTGQSGIFFVTALVTAIPLSRVVAAKARRESILWIVVLMLATVLSVKRSALVALLVGIVLLLLWDRSWRGRVRTIAIITLFMGAILPAFSWLYERSAVFRWRFERKMYGAANAFDPEDGFFVETMTDGMAAFATEPLFGVGLAGVAGIHSRYEIHGTYMSVLAETGILGFLAYLTFVGRLLWVCSRTRNRDPRTARFARAMLPLLLGLFVAFAYTNHLRKREFWITAALTCGMAAPVAAVRRPREPDGEPAPEPLLVGSGR